MTRKELLEHYLYLEMHDGWYLNANPKEKLLPVWKESRERMKILRTMIDEDEGGKLDKASKKEILEALLEQELRGLYYCIDCINANIGDSSTERNLKESRKRAELLTEIIEEECEV